MTACRRDSTRCASFPFNGSAVTPSLHEPLSFQEGRVPAQTESAQVEALYQMSLGGKIQP